MLGLTLPNGASDEPDKQPELLPRQSPGARSSHFARGETASATVKMTAVGTSTIASRERYQATPDHQSDGSEIHPIEQIGQNWFFPDSAHIRIENRHEDKSRKKDGDCCRNSPGIAADQITDECRRGENRPGCDLPHCDGIDQLLIGNPTVVIDECAVQERKEHISRAVEESANLQKLKEQPTQGVRNRRICRDLLQSQRQEKNRSEADCDPIGTRSGPDGSRQSRLHRQTAG